MDKILIAVTSTAEFPASAGMQAGRSTGFYMDEMAIPYYAMTAAGYTVDFASPLGGPPPVDPDRWARPETAKLRYSGFWTTRRPWLR